MKKIIYTVVFVLIATYSSWSQNTVDINLLQGGWYASDTNKETILVSTENRKNNPDYVLNFSNANTVQFKEKDHTAVYTYTVENDMLSLADTAYTIIELFPDKLILQEVGTTNEPIYFKKIKKYGY